MTLPLIVEAFSLVTAAAFVLSAVGNAVFFWAAWNLNYFMVAAPSDVVMSGFVLFGLFAAAWAISAAIEIVVHGWAYIFHGRLGMRGRQLTAPIHIFLRGVLFFPFGLVWIYAVITVADVSSSVRSAVHTENGTLTYPTGLKIASAALVDPDCRGAPVLWMGSAAGVAECKAGIRVFHELDGIVTEPLSAKPAPRVVGPRGEVVPPGKARQQAQAK